MLWPLNSSFLSSWFETSCACFAASFLRKSSQSLRRSSTLIGWGDGVTGGGDHFHQALSPKGMTKYCSKNKINRCNKGDIMKENKSRDAAGTSEEEEKEEEEER